MEDITRKLYNLLRFQNNVLKELNKAYPGDWYGLYKKHYEKELLALGDLWKELINYVM
jgi:hypothetical protein